MNLLTYGAELASDIEADFMLGSYNTFSNTYKRSGGYSFLCYNTQGQGWVLPEKDELYIQYAAYWKASGGIHENVKHLRLKKDGTILLTTSLDALHRVVVHSGDRANLLITGETIIQVDTWYVIEVRIKLADAPNGVCELRIDGNQEGSTFTGDTKPDANTVFNRIDLASDGSSTIYTDDVIVNDITGALNNSWANGLKVVLLKPTSDDGTNEWTPSAAVDHYSLVDEVPVSATDNLETSTTDEKERFGLEDMPAVVASIASVTPIAVAQKGAFANPDRLSIGVKIGITDYLSSAMDLGQGMCCRRNLLEESPAGGAWSKATVDALKLTLKAVD